MSMAACEPIDRDTCAEVLKIVIARLPASASIYEAHNWNKLAIDSIFELCGDEELKRRFFANNGREAVRAFESALDRIFDVEIRDLFYEVARLVYEYPEPTIN